MEAQGNTISIFKSPKYWNAMQKVNFWTKFKHLTLGCCLGAISGVFSTYGLLRYDALWRPSIFFFVFSMIPVYFLLKPKLSELIGLFFLYFVSFLTAFLGGLVIAGMMGVGSVLVFLSLFWVLRLKSYRYFIVATIVLAAIGLVIDLNSKDYFTWKGDDIDARQFQPGEMLNLGFSVIIIIWQTIALGAITLQLYTEKCYRQSLEVQKNTVGQGEEVRDPSFEGEE
jgi:hypothetical protein